MLQQSSRLDEDARCRECQYDEHKHVQSSTAPHTNRGMRDWCALHFGDVTPRRVALRMDAANHDEHDPLNGYKHGAFKNYPAQSRSLLTQGPTCWTSELPMCQREAGFQPWELAAQVELNSVFGKWQFAGTGRPGSYEQGDCAKPQNSFSATRRCL